MQTDFDDYDDLDEGGFNWMLVTVLLLAIAGFFSLAWYAYQTGSQHAPQGEMLVIKADPAPVKEKPEDAGGREFPHQEKTIYEAVNGQKEEDGVTVSIMPPAEEPQVDEAPEPADEKVAAIIKKAVEDMQQKKQPAAEPEESEPEPTVIEPETTSKPEPTPSAPASKGSRIQLGAFRSNVEAEKMWQKIYRANKDVLGDKPHQVMRADLGSKGVFYRLRVAGFDDDDAAKSVCKTLSARKQGCFVVR